MTDTYGSASFARTESKPSVSKPVLTEETDKKETSFYLKHKNAIILGSQVIGLVVGAVALGLLGFQYWDTLKDVSSVTVTAPTP